MDIGTALHKQIDRETTIEEGIPLEIGSMDDNVFLVLVLWVLNTAATLAIGALIEGFRLDKRLRSRIVVLVAMGCALGIMLSTFLATVRVLTK